MHITPFTYRLGSCNIIVSNIHSSCICDLAIYYDYFTVIAMENMIYPREANRVKLIYFNTP